MAKISIKKLVLGELDTNVYLVFDEELKEAVIIDPADEPGKIMHAIHRLSLKPVAILLTHGHFDHMLAANFLKNYYKIPIISHIREKELLRNTVQNLSFEYDCTIRTFPDKYVKNNEIITLGGIDFKVIYTPGHTWGSCVYIIENEGVLFSGDTMFAGSCGRTDYPTGDVEDMKRSLRKLLRLREDMVVFPGHGDQTVIGIERFYYQWSL